MYGYNLNQDIYLYKELQRERREILEKHHQLMQARGNESHSRFLAGLNDFFKILTHLRHIQIEVSFNHQDAQPKTSSPC